MDKILILEDEIGIRSFVSINLKREGYDVIEAGTGSEAIEKLNSEPNITVALLDIMLPDMSGVDVCRYIREKYENMGLFGKLLPELMNILERKSNGRLRSKSIY